jgi:DNA-binding response OmpR family regulator
MRRHSTNGSTSSPILVVEDDPDTREMLVELLEFEGYSVVEAETGADALQEIARQTVSAVLLDLRLPDIDGYTVCQRIRAGDQKSVPILIVSAEREPTSVAKARSAGADDYLAKPFAPDVLFNRLRVLLQQQAS